MVSFLRPLSSMLNLLVVAGAVAAALAAYGALVGCSRAAHACTAQPAVPLAKILCIICLPRNNRVIPTFPHLSSRPHPHPLRHQPCATYGIAGRPRHRHWPGKVGAWGITRQTSISIRRGRVSRATRQAHLAVQLGDVAPARPILT